MANKAICYIHILATVFIMNYQEAIQHSLTVKWKTTLCQSGESCWCRRIEPEEEIKYEDGNEIYIVGSGCVPTDYAEHIVKLHNASLNGG